MKKVKLRKLEVSALGLGCMGMSFGYGKGGEEKEMISLIHQAYELGISFFDTAEVYLGNEELVGKAIKPFRDKIILASKFGIQIQGEKQILSSDLKLIRQSIEGSLKRLQTDYLDLYYQHRVDTKVSVEEVAYLMSELCKEGKIRAWGMSEAGVQSIKKANAVFELSAVQSEYSLWWREPEVELLGILEELGIGFVPFSPLGKGFLAGKFDENTHFEKDDFRSTVPRLQNENLKQNLNLLESLKELAAKKKASLAQIALAWLLAQKTFIAPIFGTTSKQRLKENLDALKLDLSKDEVQSITNAFDANAVIGHRYSGEAAKRVGK